MYNSFNGLVTTHPFQRHIFNLHLWRKSQHPTFPASLTLTYVAQLILILMAALISQRERVGWLLISSNNWCPTNQTRGYQSMKIRTQYHTCLIWVTITMDTVSFILNSYSFLYKSGGGWVWLGFFKNSLSWALSSQGKISKETDQNYKLWSSGYVNVYWSLELAVRLPLCA